MLTVPNCNRGPTDSVLRRELTETASRPTRFETLESELLRRRDREILANKGPGQQTVIMTRTHLNPKLSLVSPIIIGGLLGAATFLFGPRRAGTQSPVHSLVIMGLSLYPFSGVAFFSP